uniref:Uncharacterized protein n=1 Tax=Saimiri boliviensis boliviensis TaxID=39432 RepID=A0A2K6THS7_SAIBB
VNIVEKVSDHVASLVFAPGILRANVWASVWPPQHCRSHCPHFLLSTSPLTH